MSAEPAALVLVVMGVSGSGKTTIARELANRLGRTFEENDVLHPAANVAKMHAGIPLDDADRAPWLNAVAAWIDRQRAGNASSIITCSSLKRSYRDIIMPASPLKSQFDALEEPAADENPLIVDIGSTPAKIVDSIIDRLHLGASRNTR